MCAHLLRVAEHTSPLGFAATVFAGFGVVAAAGIAGSGTAIANVEARIAIRIVEVNRDLITSPFLLEARLPVFPHETNI